MNFRIGIASYKRAARQFTLKYLESLHFPKDRLIMSVQCEDDLREYREAGIDKRVGKFLYREAETAGENRNTILDSVGKMERVVLIDDDVNHISRLRGKELRKIETLEELDRMIERGFFLATKHRTCGFGIYPVHNAYYMSNGYSSRNIADAGLMGIINTDMRFDTKLKTKEDYDLCCRAIKKYGAFIRLNNFAVNSPSGHKGGCEGAWKQKEETMQTAKRLVTLYPDILELNRRRPGEVKMARKRS